MHPDLVTLVCIASNPQHTLAGLSTAASEPALPTGTPTKQPADPQSGAAHDLQPLTHLAQTQKRHRGRQPQFLFIARNKADPNHSQIEALERHAVSEHSLLGIHIDQKTFHKHLERIDAWYTFFQTAVPGSPLTLETMDNGDLLTKFLEHNQNILKHSFGTLANYCSTCAMVLHFLHQNDQTPHKLAVALRQKSSFYQSKAKIEKANRMDPL